MPFDLEIHLLETRSMTKTHLYERTPRSSWKNGTENDFILVLRHWNPYTVVGFFVCLFLFSLSLLKKRFSCERQSKRERRQDNERQILHWLVYSPSGCNSQFWARLKPEAKNSILASHRGRRCPCASDLCYCLPRPIDRKLGWRQSSWDWTRNCIMWCGCCKWWPSPQCLSAAPAPTPAHTRLLHNARFPWTFWGPSAIGLS